jgi:Mrr N-terminal domain
MSKIEGVGELEIQFAVLELIKDGKIWSNADLKQRLKSQLAWSGYDKERSPTRENEFRWENRVNNALRQGIKSSLYGKGHVKSVDHGLHQITENGMRFINDDFDLNDLMESLKLPISSA